MGEVTVISILFIHWIADFVFQTDKQAQGKSKNWTDLLSHTITYSVIWLTPACILIGVNSRNLSTEAYISLSIWFSIITFFFHTAQDYITSRINSRLWEQKKVHYFFVSIGFDQFLHYVQLILTLKFLLSLNQ